MTKRVTWVVTIIVAVAVLGIVGFTAEKQRQAAAETAKLNGHNALDVDFATSMIIHDQQAILIADAALTRSPSPKVKALAAAIKAEQDPEIAKLKGWVTGWGQKYNDLSDFPQMSGHDMYPTLPGMASPEELRTLSTLTGTTFDKAFLTMMIAHHKGAIEMTQNETANGQNGRALDMARSSATSKTAELKTMEKILGTMQ